MNTYYHYQGWIYGPCDKQKPVRESYKRYWTYTQKFDMWKFYLRNLPKYQWTGPPLEDWKEMIEGKDFELKTETKADESGWISTKAITK